MIALNLVRRMAKEKGVPEDETKGSVRYLVHV